MTKAKCDPVDPNDPTQLTQMIQPSFNTDRKTNIIVFFAIYII